MIKISKTVMVNYSPIKCTSNLELGESKNSLNWYKATMPLPT